MTDHIHDWQLATTIEPWEPDPWDDVLIRPFAFCMNDDCEERLDWTEIQRRINAIDAILPLAQARVRELEIQYEQSDDDGAHYQVWQDAKEIVAALEEEDA